MKRIISRIDIKNDWVVKGIHLEGLRAIGHPEEYSKSYYAAGIDELFLMDVVASLYQRNSLYELVEKIAKDVFVPIAVGGGIRTLEDISKALGSGADKVAINTQAHQNCDFVSQAANEFGSSTIIINIEAIRDESGNYYCFTDNGREHTGQEAIEWAKQVEARGAGEIVITSVDNEGTGKGFDTYLTEAIARAVQIPVIAHGGAGNIQHVSDLLLNEANVSGVCLASILHYNLAEDIGYTKPLNSSRQNVNLSRKNISDISVSEMKDQLSKMNIPLRTLASSESNSL